jgi:hypothetical protein
MSFCNRHAGEQLHAHLSLVAGLPPGPGMLLRLLPAQLLTVGACTTQHNTARHSEDACNHRVIVTGTPTGCCFGGAAHHDVFVLSDRTGQESAVQDGGSCFLTCQHTAGSGRCI